MQVVLLNVAVCWCIIIVGRAVNFAKTIKIHLHYKLLRVQFSLSFVEVNLSAIINLNYSRREKT